MQMLDDHAREIVKAEPNWEAFEYEAIRSDGAREITMMRVRGAVAPLITRGSRKGQRNWRARDKATERTAYFTPAEHREWLKRWEAATGKCSECRGEGKTVASVSVYEGVKHRECSACHGDGKAHNT